jgi:methane monooxygenase component A beta chain/propane monooxygenase small subunit
MPTKIWPDELAGRRDFAYITPNGRRLTEYEAVTCYTQPGAHGGGLQECGDYKLRPDLRPLWDPAASQVTCSDWYAYRDPNQQWHRPYYVIGSEAEKWIDRVTDVALRTGGFDRVGPSWLQAGLVGGLIPFSHAEYGMFRTLNAAARESMSDTVNNILVFNASDKLRHAQAIAILSLDIETPHPSFDAAAGRRAWLESPLWQPARRLVEAIMAVEDWVEIVVAVCAYEAGLAEPLRRAVFNEVGARRGDPVTPTIEASATADWLRNSAAALALFEFVARDPAAGVQNRDTIRRWWQHWHAAVEAAAGPTLAMLETALDEPGLEQGARRVCEHERERLTAPMNA